MLKLSHWYRNGFLAGFEAETIDLLLIHPVNSHLASTQGSEWKRRISQWHNVGYSSGSTLRALDTPAKWNFEQIRTVIILHLTSTFETVSEAKSEFRFEPPVSSPLNWWSFTSETIVMIVCSIIPFES